MGRYGEIWGDMGRYGEISCVIRRPLQPAGDLHADHPAGPRTRAGEALRPRRTSEQPRTISDHLGPPRTISDHLGPRPQARNALADIQDKHCDILKLEASIAELHQLFLDMSVLVETQGELLDQIEYTVAQSVDYTGRAVEELRSAAKYQKRARQKCCCVIVTLLIVAGILLATIIPNFS
mmetsp:Transcript_27158/g.79308  ORF Transcript_27158/g.79308 Transcript_27158/m.79308 type:complete len:180 (-) Transcript_27158:305-844(-)